MKSKKLEVIIKRLKTLNNYELKRVINEVEAEIIFRDRSDYTMTYDDGLPDGVTNEELEEAMEIEGLKNSSYYKAKRNV
tara:strand:+ start:251 stop:487 length:237 start_codon:yes stop_codon:yes gene_type:complete